MRVEARGVTRRFGPIRALDGVAFSLPEGAHTALVGPNASGKSTLIRALVGLLHVEGEIRVDGRPIRRRDLAIARQTSYAPQSAPQLAAPVGELVDAVLRLRGATLDALEEPASRLALDLAALRPQPFRSLSGGTRQKLLLALAFAPRPRLLILDEPTASLDPGARERLGEMLAALTPGTSVLLCSHRLEEIRAFADRVLRLEEGRVVQDGPVDERADAAERAPGRLRAVETS